MKIVATLKRIEFSTFVRLLKLGITHPLFLWPTYRATKDCLQVASSYFGRAHYQNTPANAFRHAYWNYLIAKYCTNWSKNQERILSWTKSITDWHENAFKNRPLPRAMDFHNNQIGRTLFCEHRSTPNRSMLSLFLTMTERSVKICSAAEIEQNPLHLVHITD